MEPTLYCCTRDLGLTVLTECTSLKWDYWLHCISRSHSPHSPSSQNREEVLPFFRWLSFFLQFPFPWLSSHRHFCSVLTIWCKGTQSRQHNSLRSPSLPPVTGSAGQSTCSLAKGFLQALPAALPTSFSSEAVIKPLTQFKLKAFLPCYALKLCNHVPLLVSCSNKNYHHSRFRNVVSHSLITGTTEHKWTNSKACITATGTENMPQPNRMRGAYSWLGNLEDTATSQEESRKPPEELKQQHCGTGEHTH